MNDDNSRSVRGEWKQMRKVRVMYKSNNLNNNRLFSKRFSIRPNIIGVVMTEFSPKEMLSRSLRNYHDRQDRPQPFEVGPSAIGSCSRQVYHRLKRTPETNPDTEMLVSFMSDSIKTRIGEVNEYEDPMGDNFLVEQKVEYAGLKGHIDLYIKDQAMVVNWKTTAKKNLKAKNLPSVHYIYEIQVSGYLLTKSQGYKVKKVAVVSLPRDGRMEEIEEFVTDYNEEIALKGIVWIDTIKSIVEKNGQPPAPEKYKSFCEKYCSYLDPTGEVGCPSLIE